MSCCSCKEGTGWRCHEQCRDGCAASPTAAACLRARRPTLTLVRRRWQRVFWAEPALWRHLELLPDVTWVSSLLSAHTFPSLEPARLETWFAQKHQMMARVGHLVGAVAVRSADRIDEMGTRSSSGGWRLADLLHLLQPGRCDGCSSSARAACRWPRCKRCCASRSSTS